MPFTFSQPILHGADCLYKTSLPPHTRPPHPRGLAIGTLNIWDGREFGLAQAIWAMDCRGIEFMLLKYTKIQKEAYSHKKLGNDMNCLAALPSISGGDQGSVGMVTS